MATLVVAYVLAMGFEGIELRKTRKFVARLMRQPTAEDRPKTLWDKAWKEFRNVFPNERVTKPVQPTEAVAIDIIRLVDSAVGARIVKLRAEVALCRALSVGWTVLLLFFALYLFVHVLQVLVGFAFLDAPFNLAKSLISIFLVAVGVRVIGNRQRSLDDRHLRALYNHWLLLVCPRAPGISNRPVA